MADFGATIPRHATYWLEHDPEYGESRLRFNADGVMVTLYGSRDWFEKLAAGIVASYRRVDEQGGGDARD